MQTSSAASCRSLISLGAWVSGCHSLSKAKCTAARTGRDPTAAPVTHRRGLSSHCLKRNGVCLFIYKRAITPASSIGGGSGWCIDLSALLFPGLYQMLLSMVATLCIQNMYYYYFTALKQPLYVALVCDRMFTQ